MSEQASRKDTFEAALRRANRRANDVEHKLQDMSQSYADKLKAKDEAHAIAVESLQAENATLSASLTTSQESLQALSESSSRQAALEDKHARLSRLEEMRPRLAAEAAKLLDVRTQASSRMAAIMIQHDAMSALIRKFLEDIEEVSMKRLKRYGIEIQNESQVISEQIREAKVGWEKLSELVETFWNGYNGMIGERENKKKEEKQGNDEGRKATRNEKEREEQETEEKRNVERKAPNQTRDRTRPLKGLQTPHE